MERFWRTADGQLLVTAGAAGPPEGAREVDHNAWNDAQAVDVDDDAPIPED